MARCFLGLFLTYGAVQLPATGVRPAETHQQRTLAPEGPFHVDGTRLRDARGRTFLIRGTNLPEFRPDTVAYQTRSGADFGPYSGTSLSAIRLRFNMNAVRVPVAEGLTAADLTELTALVDRIHEFEMLAILAGGGPTVAHHFKNDPNVIFEAASVPELLAMRAAGARQPVVLASGSATTDPNTIQGVAPSFAGWRTESARKATYPEIARAVLSRWDLNLDATPECAGIPSDPSPATEAVQAHLAYLDRHNISWIVSEFVPAKLVRDLFQHDATTLNNGWTCGKPAWPPAGLGRVVQAHMRASDPMGFSIVGTGGGIEVARGAIAMAYGPAMGQHDAWYGGSGAVPTTLAGVSVNVTDAAGVTRPAGILWTSAGWGQINFIVPEESAEGPARMTVVRTDGSRLSANLTIARTAPGFWTDISCRGPATGTATYTRPDGSTETATLSACDDTGCASIPVRVGGPDTVRIRLDASGLRHARPEEIEVTIGGRPVPVAAYGAKDLPGKDYLVLDLPPSLAGMGDADLTTRVAGRIANVVRVRIAAARQS